MNKQIRHSLMLAFASLIWGIAFVAQTTGGNAVGPYTFTSIRSIIGSTVLIPVILMMDRSGISKKKPVTKEDKKALYAGGILCGLCVFVAANLQQLGITFGASAGKAGFLTSCYILIVPLLGLFLKKKCAWNIWISVGISLVGLYLLCLKGSLRPEFGDVLLLLCAFVFSLHILVIEHYSPLVDGVRMSCIQFLVCGVLTIFLVVFYEIPKFGMQTWLVSLQSSGAWIAILYTGIMSSGVAYTLQILGQEGLDPTVASLIMSLESVFSVIAGWILLHQYLSARELFGCLLIFSAVIFSQIPASRIGMVKKN